VEGIYTWVIVRWEEVSKWAENEGVVDAGWKVWAAAKEMYE
jgi:hypothetical protein